MAATARRPSRGGSTRRLSPGSPLNFEVRRQRSERRTRPTWASCSSSSWRCARARIDKLQNAVDSGGGGSTLALSGAAAAGGRGRLAAAVAETASDAQALQLSLLERGAASLRLEADGARESAEAAEREALAASAELARLHSQLAQLTKRLHAAEAAAARGGNSSSSPRAVSRAEELGAALGAVEASGAGGAALSVDKGAASRGAREERLQMQLASVT